MISTRYNFSLLSFTFLLLPVGAHASATSIQDSLEVHCTETAPEAGAIYDGVLQPVASHHRAETYAPMHLQSPRRAESHELIPTVDRTANTLILRVRDTVRRGSIICYGAVIHDCSTNWVFRFKQAAHPSAS